MGSCTSLQKHSNHTKYFQLHKIPEENISKLESRIVPNSLIYNYLAKHWNKKHFNQSTDTEIIDLRSSDLFISRNIAGSYNLNIENFNNTHNDIIKDFKILLDFKHVLLFGKDLIVHDKEISPETKSLIKKLDEGNLKLLSLNILNTNIDSFLDEYQLFIFENESKIQGVTLPILIYSSTDLYQPIKKIQKIKKKTNNEGEFEMDLRTKVFIQNWSRFENYFPKSLKDELNIKTILFTSPLAQTFTNKFKKNLVIFWKR